MKVGIITSVLGQGSPSKTNLSDTKKKTQHDNTLNLNKSKRTCGTPTHLLSPPGGEESTEVGIARTVKVARVIKITSTEPSWWWGGGGWAEGFVGRRLEVKGCDCFYVWGTETTGVSGHKSWLYAGGANSDGVGLKACRR